MADTKNMSRSGHSTGSMDKDKQRETGSRSGSDNRGGKDSDKSKSSTSGQSRQHETAGGRNR